MNSTPPGIHKTAVVVHLDSISESMAFPDSFDDPTFVSVMSRFIRIADQHAFPLSIYVIGKDLERKLHAEQVGKWAAAGHEIGSHSWAHRVDLSLLSRDEVRREVRRADEIISSSCGKKPRGFVAPGWAASPTVHDELLGNGYVYDMSVFPSWVALPQYLFWITRFMGTKRHRMFVRRYRDVLKSVFARRDPFVYGSEAHTRGLYIFPLPVAKMRTAVWHSLGFVIGWKAYFRLVRQSMAAGKAFYYVMHAGDLAVAEDWPDRDLARRMPRSNVPLEEKLKRFEQAIELLRGAGKEIVTMEDLAATYFKKRTEG